MTLYASPESPPCLLSAQCASSCLMLDRCTYWLMIMITLLTFKPRLRTPSNIKQNKKKEKLKTAVSFPKWLHWAKPLFSTTIIFPFLQISYPGPDYSQNWKHTHSILRYVFNPFLHYVPSVAHAIFSFFSFI